MCRFEALQELMPMQGKPDRGGVLMAAAQHIRDLQVRNHEFSLLMACSAKGCMSATGLHASNRFTEVLSGRHACMPCHSRRFLGQLVASGALDKLPQETQWSLRLLLPRESLSSAATSIFKPTPPQPEPVATCRSSLCRDSGPDGRACPEPRLSAGAQATLLEHYQSSHECY